MVHLSCSHLPHYTKFTPIREKIVVVETLLVETACCNGENRRSLVLMSRLKFKY